MLKRVIKHLLFVSSMVLRTFTIYMVVISASAIANTTINISGTVLAAPSCVINGNKNITVDFGDHINSLLINGSNYVRDVDYSLECKNFTSNTMRLMLEGTVAEFDDNSLLTNNPDLAIGIKANGQSLAINKWFTFVYPSKPALQSVLLKRAGANLKPGHFSAAATLKIDYQ